MRPEAQDWHRRNEGGESFSATSRSCGETKGAVTGTIHRYRKTLIATTRALQAMPTPVLYGPMAMADTKDWNCRFPVGDGLFCGDRVEPSRPYCKEHFATAHRPRKDKAA